MSGKGFSRRAVTIGGGIAAALGITAIGVTVPRLFGHHYRSTPYDDLFAQLIDRDQAVKIGAAALSHAHSRSAIPKRGGLARVIRQRLERRNLLEVTNSDLAEGRVLEVEGWVMPETLVLLCVLAGLEN